MDQLGSVVTTMSNPTDPFKETIPQFDLEKENISGIFTNITLLSMLLASLTKNKTLYKPMQTFNGTYDYIIVGAGTAGSVMANRLTEKPCVSVLLLEAGEEPPIIADVPSFAGLLRGTQIDWNYVTTPQKYAAFGQKDKKVFLNMGKALGGSSIINCMLYVRGNMKNYDQWEAEGATGWSYNDVLPYFLKLEDNRNIDVLDEGYHQTGGPMTMELANYIPEIKPAILEATKDMGFEVVDINGRRQTGISDVQVTTRNKQRCSTEKAYLQPVGNRPNLDVLTNAYARKILINRAKRAYGVEFHYGGKTCKVRARKEVIVATGALKTPQLLMLSGIGPKKELEELKIRVVADLPVGKNLQDHFASSLLYSLSETIIPVGVKQLNPLSITDYLINRRGPLCSPCQINLMAFLDGLNTTKNSNDFPRQQIYFVEFDVAAAKLHFNLKDDVYNEVFLPYEGKPVYICFSSVLQPYSRGQVTLSSTDPYDMPLINPNYHKDERDLKDVVEGLKICNAIARHPAMQKVKAEPVKTVFPACKELVGNEDKYLTCVARQLVNIFWHYSGTARMGQLDDPRSVVDPQLRVIGVKNLRVVNAAVFPIITSGNTNVPTMMVAEKASDMIKEGIKCKDIRSDRNGRKRNTTSCHPSQTV